MNRAVLVGRLTRDPELRQTNSGVAVASFTLAINRTYTSTVSGEREADFINCIAFNKQAENLSRYIKKGGLVGVEGRIQTRNYTAPDGTRRYVTEVVCDNVHFLEPKGTNQSGYPAYDDITPYDIPQQRTYQQNQSFKQEKQPSPYDDIPNQFDITDDDLPF